MAAIVYLATNRINGKRYIGVTCKRLRWRRAQHEYEALKGKANCRRFHAAIKKYGADIFDWMELAVFENYEDALLFETAKIAEEKPEYNLAAGGRTNKGFKHSEQFKALKSALMTGRTLSDEHKRKISEGGKNRAFNPERGRRISAAKKGKPFTPEHRAALSEARRRVLAREA